ncbi:MAG TPA: ABC transporter substrate-binding protein [Geminicoccaceae bacterium]|nr:ABC transporter substrate-binding protein [Geminicoccaceae bacterium]
MTSNLLRPTRRGILTGAAAAVGAAAAGPFLRTRRARADDKRLVVVGWGGAWNKALREHVFAPFEEQTGAIVSDDSPPLTSKVQAMVAAGNVEWDVIETDLPAILTLVDDDLLEPIDYSKIDPDRLAGIPEELRHPYGLGSSVYSLNIVYNTDQFEPGKHPSDWPAVWDGEAYPGGRTFNFQGGVSPQLEIALIADGVAIDDLYPLDVDRAWQSFDRLKPLVTKWFTSHAQAIQILSTGGAAVGCSVGAHAITASREGAPIAVDFNQGKLGGNYWAIVKGTRNRELVDQFIDFAIDPKRQAMMCQQVPYGPTNLQAISLMPPEQAAVVPTSPENLSKQFWWDVDWWGSVGPDGKTQRERQAEVYAAWMLK